MDWTHHGGKEFWENLTPESLPKYISKDDQRYGHNEDGDIPLHFAARWNQNPEVFRLMLDTAPSITEQNKSFEMPIHSAVRYSENPIVAIYALINKSPLNIGDINGRTPLHLLAMRTEILNKIGFYNSVQILIRSGQIDFFQRDKYNNTSVFYAEQNKLLNYRKKPTWFSRGEHPLLQEWRANSPIC